MGRLSPLAKKHAYQAPGKVSDQAQHCYGSYRHPNAHRCAGTNQEGDAEDEGNQARHARIVGTAVADKQVTYEIRTDVQGRESITGLADDLDEVSKVLSGELAPQTQSAAARLRELAKQDAAITAFSKLQAEVRDAGRLLPAKKPGAD